MSCWLINHTHQERKESKKKFSNRYPKYEARPGYERILQRWITDYQGIEDNDERVAQYFGDLSIDTPNDNILKLESFNIESEQFYISFGQLKGSKSITVVNTQIIPLSRQSNKFRETL